MNTMIKRAAWAGLIASWPVNSAYAATLNVVISGEYQSQGVAFLGMDVVEEVVGGNEYVVSDTSDSFVSLSGGLQDDDGNVSVSVTSTGSADAASGELKLTTSHSMDAYSVPDPFDEVFASSDLSTGFRIYTGIMESFTVSGTGTASFSAFVDVTLIGNSQFTAWVGEMDAIGNPLNFDPTGANLFSVSNSGAQQASFVDELVTFEIDFLDAVDEVINIGWSSFAQTEATEYCSVFADCSEVDTASVDASGTTNIFFSATDELTVRSGATSFLGQSDFQVYDPDAPSPVPLPAGAVLLLTGIAGLGFARRRNPSVEL